jgi:hypothetical protein
MIPFLGRVPDRPEWRADPAFNREVASLLLQVYARLSREKRPSPAEMDELHARLPAYEDESCRMCQQQRIALACLHCQTLLGGTARETIEEPLTFARALAERTEEVDALAECDFLEGWSHQAQMRYASAARAFEDAATKLATLRESGDGGDPALELRALSELAVHRFLMADYAAAEACVESGKRLALLAKDSAAAIATLWWVKALLQRWRGRLEDALTCAYHAADLLSSDPNARPYGRILGVAAEISLDLAERYSPEPPAHGRTVWLAMAHSRIAEAESIAAASQDTAGAILAMLADIRHSRMSSTGGGAERIARIEQAQATLPRDDATLRCQLETAIGHEFDALGNHKEALSHYRAAVNIASEQRSVAGEQRPPVEGLAQALLMWPRREILRSAEMVVV